ncbi:MAG: O-acetyl-ADP-ribose deacetylase [Chloroflexi bacterium]|nr:O-acetyl-ADP-ribose deacetylase [Chloroflexota bacterium]
MKVKLVKGDITKLRVDAIVNAANSTLLGGGGVDGAIHSAAGPQLLEECRRIRATQLPGGLPAGDAVITNGYRLPAAYVIHTVGPVYNPNRDQSDVLASCFKKSLDVAEANRLRSIAFPAVSTGVYGYPKEECAGIARKVFDDYPYSSLAEVMMCLYSEADLDVFRRIFESR